jgi:hypothetical protein
MRPNFTENDKHPPSKSSRIRRGERTAGMKTNGKSAARHPTHFYDPNGPNETESSSDEEALIGLSRRENDTLGRIENAEASLAKERKRVEQLEIRRKEAEAREEQRRRQQIEEASLTPREKNRRVYEKAVARVERNALRKIEELDRRFAHSDKVFELQLARQNREVDEQRQQEAT